MSEIGDSCKSNDDCDWDWVCAASKCTVCCETPASNKHITTSTAIGIGVSIPIVVALLAGAGFFLWRSRRRKQAARLAAAQQAEDHKPELEGSSVAFTGMDGGKDRKMSELLGSTAPVAELPNDLETERAELPTALNMDPIELDATEISGIPSDPNLPQLKPPSTPNVPNFSRPLSSRRASEADLNSPFASAPPPVPTPSPGTLVREEEARAAAAAAAARMAENARLVRRDVDPATTAAATFAAATAAATAAAAATTTSGYATMPPHSSRPSPPRLTHLRSASEANLPRRQRWSWEEDDDDDGDLERAISIPGDQDSQLNYTLFRWPGT